ncbi:MAG: response regulator [Lawsonibacter sp.]
MNCKHRPIPHSIVDDSGINRMMLSELLEDRYDILEASNGVEALALIRQNLSSLDLVLLDIVMPELDGFGVLAHMKSATGWSLSPSL